MVMSSRQTANCKLSYDLPSSKKPDVSATLRFDIAIGWFILLFYVLTIAKLGPGVLNWAL
jgi:hypothetical protein